MSKKDLISVVVHANNSGKYIDDCMKSLMSQTYQNFEIIVVDDGSTDDTPKKIKSWVDSDFLNRIKVLTQKNQGHMSAILMGSRLSRGKYVVWQDANNIAYKDRLEVQYNFLKNNENIKAVGGAVEVFLYDDSEHGLNTIFNYAANPVEIQVLTLFKAETYYSAMMLDAAWLLENLNKFNRFDFPDWRTADLLSPKLAISNLSQPVVKFRFNYHDDAIIFPKLENETLTCLSSAFRLNIFYKYGIFPTEEEMRLHMGISPCLYWDFGAHQYFDYYATQKDFMQKVKNWLEKIRTALSKSFVYGQPIDVDVVDEVLDKIYNLVEIQYLKVSG